MAGVSKFPQLSVAKATHGTPIALKGDPVRANLPRLMAGEQGQGAFVYTATRGYRQAYRASQRAMLGPLYGRGTIHEHSAKS